MKATMVVESRPPERQEPTGTSERSRRSTLLRKSCRKAAGSGSPSLLSCGVQYAWLGSGVVSMPGPSPLPEAIAAIAAAFAAPSGISIQAAAGTW